MVNRGFGLEIEQNYGDTTVAVDDFDLDFWNQADSVDFKLNDDLVTKSGSSRMNKRVRPGYLKPTGSTSADADLQQLAWYFLGYLDNYKHTAGQNDLHIHEYWGGECKQLTSFRGLAVYDMLKQYIYGMLLDKLKLEVGSEGMTVGADWVYSTEESRIIGNTYNGTVETFEQPDELVNEDIFIMPYDLDIVLNSKPLTHDILSNTNVASKSLTYKASATALEYGVCTDFSFDGSNNHDVDKTMGLGSRAPQKRANAQKRENGLGLTASLTEETVRSILDAKYGQVGAVKPTSCKILRIPFELIISHCENPNLRCNIVFPQCTLRVEFSLSGADAVEVALSLDTLGTGTANLADNTEVETDIYVRLVNNQPELAATQ